MTRVCFGWKDVCSEILVVRSEESQQQVHPFYPALLMFIFNLVSMCLGKNTPLATVSLGPRVTTTEGLGTSCPICPSYGG